MLAVSVLAALSCSNLNTDEVESAVDNHVALSKIISSAGSDINSNSLLVKFKSVPEAGFLESLQMEGVCGIEPLFVSVKGKEELESRFGLDRWYEIHVENSGNLNEIALSLADCNETAVIQYNSIAKKASDCIVYPYVDDDIYEAAATRADEIAVFNDPSLKDQWHYINQGNASIATQAYKGADINVKDVWASLTCGDPDIIVAVVDEGVKYSHPDLNGNMWVNEKELNGQPGVDDDGNGYVDDIYGYNFVSNGGISWGKDGDVSHGTHCAGTIAAVNNNGQGVCGVAGGSGKGDGCRIMSCQIFDGNKGGSVSVTSKAIKYAADMGASVISCSFGYSTAFSSDDAYIKSQGSAEIDAIHYFEATTGNNTVLDGNIAVFAAGNEAHPYAHYPGAYYDIISVSAFAPDFLPTYYTNYGSGCNIVAPGGEYYLSSSLEKSAVLSTITSENKKADYGYMQGTSMACPHVAGVVALALSYSKKIGKTFSRERFKEMILSSANDIDSRLSGTKQYYANAMNPLSLSKFYHQMGTGSIDAWRLMMNIEGIPCLVAETGKRQWLDLSDYFGTASVNLTYLGLEISAADKAALGLAEEPEIKYGRLYIHPTKLGSGKIRITAVGGGEAVGGGNRPTGGMEISQEISVISRSFKSSNGGWL